MFYSHKLPFAQKSSEVLLDRSFENQANWRDDRVVEGSSLENCRVRKDTVGSNPTLSATSYAFEPDI